MTLDHVCDAAERDGLDVVRYRERGRLRWIEIRGSGPLACDVHRALVECGFVIRRPRAKDRKRIAWRLTMEAERE